MVMVMVVGVGLWVLAGPGLGFGRVAEAAAFWGRRRAYSAPPERSEQADRQFARTIRNRLCPLLKSRVGPKEGGVGFHPLPPPAFSRVEDALLEALHGSSPILRGSCQQAAHDGSREAGGTVGRRQGQQGQARLANQRKVC